MNFKYFLIVSFFTACTLISLGNGYKILVLLPLSPRSQKIAFDSIVEELSKKSHEITYVSMYKSSHQLPGVKTILLSSKLNDYFEEKAENAFNSSLSFSMDIVKHVVNIFPDMCEMLMQDETFMTFAKNPGSYDVTIVNSMIHECYLFLAAKIGAPIVMVSVASLFPNVAWALDIPNPLSYLPMPMLPYDFNMNFFQRTINFLASNGMHAAFGYVIAPLSERVVQKYFPDAPSTYEIIRNTSLVLVNTHVSLEGARPSLPYMVEVGCIPCNPGKPLPEAFQKFVDEAGDDGFIVFSLGTVVKGSFMTENFVKAFVTAFGQMKQRVFWKYEKQIEGLPPNVKIVSWLPQQDLMAHPKCKLAITHGGLLSLQEVAYHGVPLLGVPLGADRVRNIYRATKDGYALPLNDWQNLTTEGTLQILNELIYNTKYREKAQEISRLMKDRPEHPLQTSVYWIEYIMRHKGAPHLKSGAQHLNILQYYLIDVITFILGTLALIFSLFYFILRMCWRCLFSNKTKQQIVKNKKKQKTK